MQPIRLLLAQRHLAVLLLAAALLLKLLVPTGYMIGASGGRLAVIVCPGVVPAPSSVSQSAAAHQQMAGGHQMAMADHGAPMKHDGSGGHGQVEMPCAFAGLSAATLGAVDPIQLAALIAFVLAMGVAAVVLPAVARPVYLRPPLRGPPAFL